MSEITTTIRRLERLREINEGVLYKLRGEFLHLYIIKVSTGWVLRDYSSDNVSLCFIPDPDHLTIWDLQ